MKTSNSCINIFFHRWKFNNHNTLLLFTFDQRWLLQQLQSGLKQCIHFFYNTIAMDALKLIYKKKKKTREFNREWMVKRMRLSPQCKNYSPAPCSQEAANVPLCPHRWSAQLLLVSVACSYWLNLLAVRSLRQLTGHYYFVVRQTGVPSSRCCRGFLLAPLSPSLASAFSHSIFCLCCRTASATRASIMASVKIPSSEA